MGQKSIYVYYILLHSFICSSIRIACPFTYLFVLYHWVAMEWGDCIIMIGTLGGNKTTHLRYNLVRLLNLSKIHVGFKDSLVLRSFSMCLHAGLIF